MLLLLLTTLNLLLFNLLLNFMTRTYLWLLIILFVSNLGFSLLFMLFLLVFLLLLLFCLLLCAFLLFLYCLRRRLFLLLLLYNLFYLAGFLVIDIFWRCLRMVHFETILVGLIGLKMVDSSEQWLNKLIFALKLLLLLRKLAHLLIEILYFEIILFNKSTLFPQLIFVSRYLMFQLFDFYYWAIFLLLKLSQERSVFLDRGLEGMDLLLQLGSFLT